MGVIKQPRKILIQTGDSNSEQSSVAATDDESGRETPVAPSAGGGVEGRRNPLCPLLLSTKIGYSLKMKKGRRSKQRFENERLLMAMYGVESQDYQPGQDVCKNTNSHFTELLDDENRAILEEFLNNEESKYFNVQEEEEDELENDLNEPREEIAEQNFQAEDAYMRIGTRLRQAFKKSVPLGMLRAIEDDINDSFTKAPTGEFVCELSSFERLLVHALSAYNSLNSHSFDGKNGKRVVKVENPRKNFEKKDPLLTEYIIARNNL